MYKSTSQIFKEMFPQLLIITLILAVMGVFVELAGFSLGNLIIQNPALTDPNNGAALSGLEGADMIPSLDLSLHGLLILVLNAITGVFSLFLGYGISLAIYRKIKYDTDLQLIDYFYFFNRHFVLTLVVGILVSIVTGLGLLLLIVPGIIISMGFYPIGVFIAKAQEENLIGPIAIMKETWRKMKGHKTMVFGRLIVYGIIMVALSAVIGFVMTMFFVGGTAFGAYSAMGSEPTMGTMVIGAIGTLITSLVGMILYIPQIDIFRELIEKNVFDPELTNEEEMEQDLRRLEEEEQRRLWEANGEEDSDKDLEE